MPRYSIQITIKGPLILIKPTNIPISVGSQSPRGQPFPPVSRDQEPKDESQTQPEEDGKVKRRKGKLVPSPYKARNDWKSRLGVSNYGGFRWIFVDRLMTRFEMGISPFLIYYI